MIFILCYPNDDDGFDHPSSGDGRAVRAYTSLGRAKQYRQGDYRILAVDPQAMTMEWVDA